MKKKVIELEEGSRIESLEWQKFKECGIDGVMIPLGNADYYGRVAANDFFESCVNAAKESGLMVGAIINICCKDPFSAHEAAFNTVEILERYKIKPAIAIAYGFFERKRACLIEQGKDGLTDTALSLLFETERLGYRGIIYTDFNFADTYMDIKRISGKRFWGEQALQWNDKLIMKMIGEDDVGYITELNEFRQHILG